LLTLAPFSRHTETQDIRAERSDEVAAAARELWDAQLSEAFGTPMPHRGIALASPLA
jgi:hypothetical protein